MTIADGRFGGEVVSPKGKVFKFDSSACLITFARTNPDTAARVYLLDYLHPGSLLAADKAVLVQFKTRASPMDSEYVAVSSLDGARQLLAKQDPAVLTWADLLRIDS